MNQDVLNTLEDKLKLLDMLDDIKRTQLVYLWVRQSTISYRDFQKIITWWLNDSKVERKIQEVLDGEKE